MAYTDCILCIGRISAGLLKDNDLIIAEMLYIHYACFFFFTFLMILHYCS